MSQSCRHKERAASGEKKFNPAHRGETTGSHLDGNIHIRRQREALDEEVDPNRLLVAAEQEWMSALRLLHPLSKTVSIRRPIFQ